MGYSFRRYLKVAAGILLVSTTNVSANSFSSESSVTLASQYLWRGFDLNQEDPALQGDYIIKHDSGFWVGAWGSNYDVVIDDGIEIDLMAGYEMSLTKDFTIGVGVTEYTYSGDLDSSTEYFVSLSMGQVGFSYYNDTDLDTNYFSVDADFDLIKNFSLALHAGHNNVDNGENNQDYSISINYAASKQMSLFATYSDNDLDVEGAEDYFVIGASYSF